VDVQKNSANNEATGIVVYCKNLYNIILQKTTDAKKKLI